MKILNKISMLILPFAALISSCDNSQSYSDLLRDEEKATNAYMADQKIELDVPADSIFISGDDAPFYKMDDEGYLYMKVVNAGDKNNRPKKGDTVYFRFMRKNLKLIYDGYNPNWEGNADNMNNPLGATSIIYGYPSIEGTALYGTGIQVPLDYLGYDSEVEMVIRSYQGFTTDQSQCIPYVYKIKYYKAEY